MNFMEILNNLIDKSDEEVLAYFRQKDEELSFIDEFFRNFLVFLKEQKEAMEEHNPQLAERIIKIVEILMLFAGAQLRVSDSKALFMRESQESFKAEDKRAKMIEKLETRSIEAIELKNRALAEKNPILMERAETIYLENIKQWEEMNLSNPGHLIRDIYQLALIYKNQERFRESEDLLKRVIGHFASIGNEEEFFQHKIELGRMYLQAYEPAKASQVLEECREYFETPGKEVDEYALYFIYTGLAKIKFIFNEQGYERPMKEGLTYLVKTSFFKLMEIHERYIRSVVSYLELYKEYENYNEVLEKVLAGMEITGAQLSLRLNGYEL